MQVTIDLKCDRSGRVQSKQIEDTEIPAYKERKQTREAALEKVKEAFKQIPPGDLPDLICVYRGEFKSFINVIAEYNDDAISRLLGQLFHVSDPSARAEKARKTRNEKKPATEASASEAPKDNNKKDNKKGAKSGVQEKASTGV